MRKMFLAVVCLCSGAFAFGQVDEEWNNFLKQQNNSFEQFQKQSEQDFEAFRKQINAEFAKFMAQAWGSEETQPKEDIPWKPEPPKPVVVDPQQRPKANPIPFNPPMPPKPIVRPEPVAPVKPQPKPVEPDRPTPALRPVKMFGTEFGFTIDNKHALSLKDNSETSVAQLWEQLGDRYFDNILAECLQYRSEYKMCDWAYFLLTKSVAETCFGRTNEAVVMHMYLLTQSGFQVRICRGESKLAVLLGSDELLYKYDYFNLDGKRFYLMDKTIQEKSMYIFNHAFPKEHAFSLALSQPQFSVSKTEKRTVSSKRYPQASATVETNKNLIDFYNTYPLSSQWQYYSAASLSETVKQSLYPVLRKAIQGKTESEAANILINYVQTGFQYAKDDEQFGYERPLFPDETFYYPYSDCEDRAILFSNLVRELMGLEVVLLHYPGHLASAVHFHEDVTGDYLTVDGKKFIVTDPTYIGATIGMCMPQYKEVKANVVKFQ